MEKLSKINIRKQKMQEKIDILLNQIKNLKIIQEESFTMRKQIEEMEQKKTTIRI